MSKDKPAKPESNPVTYQDRDGEIFLTVSRSANIAYEELTRQWSNCELCPLYGSRSKVVFARGMLPADVLFIGDAPGPLEDYAGFPFLGPSGRLFNTALRELYKSRQSWSYAIANPIGCIPWKDVNGYECRQPTEKEITACNPRFVSLIRIANPQGVVLIGPTAESYWAKYAVSIQTELGRKLKAVSIYHPSYVLRNGGAGVENDTYRNLLSSLKSFLFTTLDVGV